jgi:hypothetical protein
MKSYAFIIGSPSLPSLFLVEVSRYTVTTLMQLAYYEPNIIFCPPSVSKILRCLSEDMLLFTHYGVMGKAIMYRTVVASPLVTLEHAQGALIAEIIAFELETQPAVSSRTRSSSLQNTLVKELCLHTRDKRLIEEQHLKYPSFSADVRRSLGEMHHHVWHVFRTKQV